MSFLRLQPQLDKPAAAMWEALPVPGRPRFLGATLVDFFIF
jgi:hypothetical protein